ncbi:MAG: terpene cyclase/mutase family protein [Planctomycetota bacterium]|nr:terpene cyclase/mutase family protein [Planctomycetota bacterium]
MTDGSESQERDELHAVPPLPGDVQSVSALPSHPAPKKSVLQTVEQRGRKRKRRKPPAWAIKVGNSIITAKHFLREKLPGTINRRKSEIVTAAVSFLIHLVGALLLTIWLLPVEARDSVIAIISGRLNEEPLDEPLEIVEIVQPEKITDLNLDSTMKQMVSELDNGLHREQFDSPEDTELRMPIEDIVEIGDIAVLKGDFGGRSAAGRRAAIKKYGGTAESEKSVNLGLTWLQKIQRKDGSWSFGDVGAAGSPGSMQTTDVGATSLALLCMLGGGHTHATPGQYQETVQKGLVWLMKSGIRSPAGTDMRGAHQGNSGMYVQGLATICLCEASALEPKDRELRKLALEAARFIEKSQGSDGGWRYQPRDVPGDTSVVGWQVMALQSAKAGGISVAPDSFSDARKFLNSVQVDDGVYYGYTEPQKGRATTTAVGLLCRMYLGWKREKPQLKQGVEYLSGLGPSQNDMYYNYYATQVLHHWDGELWERWNQRMRDQLVETQVKEGPGAGSWNVTDPHGGTGGRIYQTALSLLTLEVYYRHLPIYRRFDSDNKSAKESVSVATP